MTNLVEAADQAAEDLVQQYTLLATTTHAEGLASTALIEFTDIDGTTWVVTGGAKLSPGDVDQAWVGQQLALCRALEKLHADLYNSIRFAVEG